MISEPLTERRRDAMFQSDRKFCEQEIASAKMSRNSLTFQQRRLRCVRWKNTSRFYRKLAFPVTTQTADTLSISSCLPLTTQRPLCRRSKILQESSSSPCNWRTMKLSSALVRVISTRLRVRRCCRWSNLVLGAEFCTTRLRTRSCSIG